MNKQRITGDKLKLSEADRLQICTLLVKAGYTVRIGKEKEGSAIRYFVEYWRES